MSTVIECPECCTRYKLNKDIPEGGRYVKCARCGHQWRVSPEASLDDAAGAERANHNVEEDEQSSASTEDTPQASAPFPSPPPPPPAESEADDFSDWQTRREFHAFTVSNMQGEADSEDGGDTAIPDGNTLKNSWMGYEDDGLAQDSHEESFNPASMQGSADDGDVDWAKTLDQQSWNNVDEHVPDENPEFAIRSALNSALEPTGYQQPAQGESADGDEPFNEFWEGFSAERDNADLSGDAPAYGNKDLNTVAAEIQNARRNSVIYDAATAHDGFSEEDDLQNNNAGATADFALQQNMADALRAAASKDDAPFGQKGPAVFSGSEQDDDFHFGAEYMDGDMPGLQNQLEKYEHMPYEEPRRGGGLAVVAAWAVFLSIASGLLLALVNFRNDVVTALPGTVELYRLAGFYDVGHDIDFGNVSYHWTTANGKPVVAVTGQVINRTNHTIQVPQVLVNMRDNTNADLLSTTANVQTRELAGQQRADFTLELAVSTNINQIELEFDKIQ